MKRFHVRVSVADLPMQSQPQSETNCCYATPNRHRSVDPTGIAWESFHTLGTVESGQ